MRLSIALITLAVTALHASHASACCWTNWLYGRTATPYVAGYAPVSYTAGYAPVSYTAGYAPVATPYAANYRVATPTTVLPPATALPAPVLTNGAYQAQRPTYYNNPSVYTGQPVTGVYQAGRIPVASNYRGNAASPAAHLGAANQYPDTYVSGYASAQVPVVSPGLPLAGTTTTGVPSAALPATQVAPLFAPTPPQQSGLGRFFGSAFGTNYRSSYFRAPVTYYRPATTIDPISGTTVTVQQPCTSYTQQLQRTPYASLQAPGTTYSAPASSCNTPACNNTLSAASTPGYSNPPGFAPTLPSGIGQASATAPIGQRPPVSPIPSTGGYYGQPTLPPNQAPLTGAPNSTGPTPAPIPGSGSRSASPGSAGDMAPLDQPSIRNREPVDQEEDRDKADDQPESYWKLQNADDSMAMIRQRQTRPYQAQPISAPEDYESPFRGQFEQPSTPADRERSFSREDLEAPPLPSRSFESVQKSYDSNWISAPVREASTGSRSRTRREIAPPIARDTTWSAPRR